MKYAFEISTITNSYYRGILDFTNRTLNGRPLTQEEVEHEATEMYWFKTYEGRLINAKYVVTISLTKLEYKNG